MKLYFLIDEKRYVHRQSDIPKGADFEPQDIPTDLAGLMAHLNALWKNFQGAEAPSTEVEAPEVHSPPEAPPRAPELTVKDCIAIEEAIQDANPIQLRVFAENVAARQKELDEA